MQQLSSLKLAKSEEAMSMYILKLGAMLVGMGMVLKVLAL